MLELNLGNTLFERSNDQDEFMIYAHENKIDHKIAIDEHIERTCYVIIQHLKNVVCFQKNIKESYYQLVLLCILLKTMMWYGEQV